MSRNYGNVRSGRRGGAIWQWMIIGLVLGFGCAAVFVLAGLTFGIVNLDFTGQAAAMARVTPTAWIVTATVDPSLPTQTPFVVTATPDTAATEIAAQTAAANSQIVPPTPTLAPTDTPQGAEQQQQPVTQPTTQTTDPGTTGQQTTTTGGDTRTTGSTIPPQLAALASPLVPIDGGTFRMGTTFPEITEAVRICGQLGGQCLTEFGEDSTPDRDVTLDGFAIERTEVSYEQYVAFLNYLLTTGRNHTNGCGTTIPQRCTDTRNVEDPNSNITFDSANYDVALSSQLALPVVNVTWFGADAYCRAIGRRLPTEAEWERAARGPSNNLYPWGNEWNPDNAKTSRSTDTAQGPLSVTTFELVGASGFGVVNMAGNAAEWVFDWYSPSYYQPGNDNAVNPQGPLSGVDRVTRGGSWADHPFFARAVHRQHFPPQNDYATVGFRCAADLDTLQPQTGGGVPATIGSGTTGDGSFVVPPGATLDPLQLGTLDNGSTGGSAPQLPTAPGANAAPTESIATLQP